MKKLLIVLFVAVGVASCHTPPTPEPTYERKYDPWKSFVNIYTDITDIEYIHTFVTKSGYKYLVVWCNTKQVSAEREDTLREFYSDLLFYQSKDYNMWYKNMYPNYPIYATAEPVNISVYSNRNYGGYGSYANHPAGTPLNDAIFIGAGAYYNFIASGYDYYQLVTPYAYNYYYKEYVSPYYTKSSADNYQPPEYFMCLNTFKPLNLLTTEEKMLFCPKFYIFFDSYAGETHTFTIEVEYRGKKFTKSIEVTFE